MHIEKNVCESIIGTLLNILGKTKDGLNCHLDLVDMGLRSELAPRFESKRTYLPPTCYTLSKMEKKGILPNSFTIEAEKIKANLNRENTQEGEGGELGFKLFFSNTINSSKRRTNIKIKG